MKPIITITSFFLLIMAFVIACKKGQEVIPEEEPEEKKGKNMFYINKEATCGPIEVTIQNSTKNITSSAGNSPSCSHSGSAVFELPEGEYNYTAKCQSGDQTWSGKIIIYKNECYTTLLEIEEETLPTHGTALFWINQDYGCGPIDVSVDNSTRKITRYIHSGHIPDCSEEEVGATFELPPGVYAYTASCPQHEWEGKFEILVGQCSPVLLGLPTKTVPEYEFGEPVLIRTIGVHLHLPIGWRSRFSKSGQFAISTGTWDHSETNQRPNPLTTSDAFYWTVYESFSSDIKKDFRKVIDNNKTLQQAYSSAQNHVHRFINFALKEDLSVVNAYRWGNKVLLVFLPHNDDPPKPLYYGAEIGELTGLFYNSRDELILISKNNNGSLIRLNEDGSLYTIVSNLYGIRSVVDFEESYYVASNDIGTGSVFKVSYDGRIEVILENMTTVADLIFDNHGSLILQHTKTIGATNYLVYSMYTKYGAYITQIADSNNNLLYGTGGANGTNMFIDKYNNLILFPGKGYPDTGASDRLNMWRISLKKK